MTPSEIHIYTVDSQPMTRYCIYQEENGKRWWKMNKARAVFQCINCHRSRWAKNLRIKVYYDTMHVFCAERCAPGKG